MDRPAARRPGGAGVDFKSIDASQPGFDPNWVGEWDLVFNRMSPSAWTRGHLDALLHTPRFLASVEEAGIPVVNGRRAYEYELSKRNQLDLLRRLRVRHPEGRPVLNPEEIPGAGIDLEFPVLVKPNIGGSGAGISSFATPEQLEMAVEYGVIDLGPDGTGLVQEHLPARGDVIVRIEIVGGEFLYAIELKLLPGSFNLCPADYCDLKRGVTGPEDLVRGVRPNDEVIEEAKRVLEAAGAEVGGVEYLVNERDGEAYFYDFNAMSNFVADAPKVIGFNPYLPLADYLIERAAAGARV
ncbi:MAG: RimK family alpha-L-glutamate ligase [Acidimicrobiia bacterium]